MKKEHAEHNESVCDFLLSSEKYNDWVITTAFYSALHFVQHEIFPLEIGEEDFDTFDDYFSSLNRNNSGRVNKHTVTLELVKVQLNLAFSNYKWLYDACWSARYKNYNVSLESAKTARKRLAQLKGFLKK